MNACYFEMYNPDWWKRAQTAIPVGAKLISQILYSDATTCDVLGETSRHPIFLTLLILAVGNQTERKSNTFRM